MWQRKLKGTIPIGAVMVAMGLCLSGCTGQYLEVPKGASDISLCPSTSAPYPVTEIGKHKMASCDLAGDTLVLPDKYQIAAPSQGVNRGISGPSAINPGPGIPTENTFELVNLGTYGLVVGEFDHKTRATHWWGTSAGLSLYWNAFGTKITPDAVSKKLPN